MKRFLKWLGSSQPKLVGLSFVLCCSIAHCVLRPWGIVHQLFNSNVSFCVTCKSIYRALQGEDRSKKHFFHFNRSVITAVPQKASLIGARCERSRTAAPDRQEALHSPTSTTLHLSGKHSHRKNLFVRCCKKEKNQRPFQHLEYTFSAYVPY